VGGRPEELRDLFSGAFRLTDNAIVNDNRERILFYDVEVLPTKFEHNLIFGEHFYMSLLIDCYICKCKDSFFDETVYPYLTPSGYYYSGI
jgi:hypothetical protein